METIPYRDKNVEIERKGNTLVVTPFIYNIAMMPFIINAHDSSLSNIHLYVSENVQEAIYSIHMPDYDVDGDRTFILKIERLSGKWAFKDCVENTIVEHVYNIEQK